MPTRTAHAEGRILNPATVEASYDVFLDIYLGDTKVKTSKKSVLVPPATPDGPGTSSIVIFDTSFTTEIGDSYDLYIRLNQTSPSIISGLDEAGPWTFRELGQDITPPPPPENPRVGKIAFYNNEDLYLHQTSNRQLQVPVLIQNLTDTGREFRLRQDTYNEEGSRWYVEEVRRTVPGGHSRGVIFVTPPDPDVPAGTGFQVVVTLYETDTNIRQDRVDLGWWYI